jgi:hypothetical protein
MRETCVCLDSYTYEFSSCLDNCLSLLCTGRSFFFYADSNFPITYTTIEPTILPHVVGKVDRLEEIRFFFKRLASGTEMDV